MNDINVLNDIFEKEHAGKFIDVYDPLDDSNIAKSYTEWKEWYYSRKNDKYMQFNLIQENFLDEIRKKYFKFFVVGYMTNPIASLNNKMYTAKLKKFDNLYDIESFFISDKKILLYTIEYFSYGLIPEVNNGIFKPMGFQFKPVEMFIRYAEYEGDDYV